MLISLVENPGSVSGKFSMITACSFRVLRIVNVTESCSFARKTTKYLITRCRGKFGARTNFGLVVNWEHGKNFRYLPSKQLPGLTFLLEEFLLLQRSSSLLPSPCPDPFHGFYCILWYADKDDSLSSSPGTGRVSSTESGSESPEKQRSVTFPSRSARSAPTPSFIKKDF